ncbi:MAG TPA: PHP domain-containing protein [Longimicrobiaceae bacterium]|nr:PHP domain-containing protein [Longimicrobiaceae bacterium]
MSFSGAPPMKIDLHLHSHVSDGQLSPTRLMEAARAGGLDMVALTDHDTAAGVSEARDAAEALGLEFVPGIEISTRHGSHEFHILGYGIDEESDSIRAHQTASVRRRTDRMRGMVDRLHELGVRVTFEEVLTAAGPARSLGRPHLARALLAGGHTRFYGEAFSRYISDGGPAFVSQGFPGVDEAIQTIHDAGGVAVWAHPPLDAFEDHIRPFASFGLDGVECFRPGTLPLDLQLLEGVTRDLGLFPTGGSDWHGPHRAVLGDFFLRPEDIPEVLERVCR